MRALNHLLANLLRQEHPELCATLDRGLRMGLAPAELLRAVEGRVAEITHRSDLPALVTAYLREVDPDFDRDERERECHRLLCEG